MKDIYEEYDDVFRDIVKSYLEDNNINKISDDEIRIISNRLMNRNNESMWETINECIYYEVQRIKDLRKKNKKEEER